MVLLGWPVDSLADVHYMLYVHIIMIARPIKAGQKIWLMALDQPAIAVGRCTTNFSDTCSWQPPQSCVARPATTSGRHPRAAGCNWRAGWPPWIPVSRRAGNVVLDLSWLAIESPTWRRCTQACWPWGADAWPAGPCSKSSSSWCVGYSDFSHPDALHACLKKSMKASTST